MGIRDGGLMAEAERLVPVRILAICRNMLMPFHTGKPGEPPKMLPNCRSMLLVYTPLDSNIDLPIPTEPGVRDPPIEVHSVEVRDPVAAKFLSIMSYN